MDNILLEIAKFFGTLIGALAGAVKLLGARQDRALRKIEDKLVAMDKRSAEDMAAMKENVQRLRENVNQNREDLKESIKEITSYLYNRPR